MKKRSEQTYVEYTYDTADERAAHVETMESAGWECSGQVKETKSVYSKDFVWIGKFSKQIV
jgi:hypothetical protein